MAKASANGRRTRKGSRSSKHTLVIEGDPMTRQELIELVNSYAGITCGAATMDGIMKVFRELWIFTGLAVPTKKGSFLCKYYPAAGTFCAAYLKEFPFYKRPYSASSRRINAPDAVEFFEWYLGARQEERDECVPMTRLSHNRGSASLRLVEPLAS